MSIFDTGNYEPKSNVGTIKPEATPDSIDSIVPTLLFGS